MERFLAITVTSYALLGNIALAGVSVAAENTPEVNMTPVSAEDLAMTPLQPRVEEQKNQAVLACKEQGERKAVQAPGTREACPTDRCIVVFDDQAKSEGIALLSGKQEVFLSAATTPRVTAEHMLGSTKNRTREAEGGNLIATITSSVIFRE